MAPEGCYCPRFVYNRSSTLPQVNELHETGLVPSSTVIGTERYWKAVLGPAAEPGLGCSPGPVPYSEEARLLRVWHTQMRSRLSDIPVSDPIPTLRNALDGAVPEDRGASSRHQEFRRVQLVRHVAALLKANADMHVQCVSKSKLSRLLKRWWARKSRMVPDIFMYGAASEEDAAYGIVAGTERVFDMALYEQAAFSYGNPSSGAMASPTASLYFGVGFKRGDYFRSLASVYTGWVLGTHGGYPTPLGIYPNWGVYFRGMPPPLSLDSCSSDVSTLGRLPRSTDARGVVPDLQALLAFAIPSSASILSGHEDPGRMSRVDPANPFAWVGSARPQAPSFVPLWYTYLGGTCTNAQVGSGRGFLAWVYDAHATNPARSSWGNTGIDERGTAAESDLPWTAHSRFGTEFVLIALANRIATGRRSGENRRCKSLQAGPTSWGAALAFMYGRGLAKEPGADSHVLEMRMQLEELRSTFTRLRQTLTPAAAMGGRHGVAAGAVGELSDLFRYHRKQWRSNMTAYWSVYTWSFSAQMQVRRDQCTRSGATTGGNPAVRGDQSTQGDTGPNGMVPPPPSIEQTRATWAKLSTDEQGCNTLASTSAQSSIKPQVDAVGSTFAFLDDCTCCRVYRHGPLTSWHANIFQPQEAKADAEATESPTEHALHTLADGAACGRNDDCRSACCASSVSGYQDMGETSLGQCVQGYFLRLGETCLTDCECSSGFCRAASPVPRHGDSTGTCADRDRRKPMMHRASEGGETVSFVTVSFPDVLARLGAATPGLSTNTKPILQAMLNASIGDAAMVSANSPHLQADAEFRQVLAQGCIDCSSICGCNSTRNCHFTADIERCQLKMMERGTLSTSRAQTRQASAASKEGIALGRSAPALSDVDGDTTIMAAARGGNAGDSSTPAPRSPSLRDVAVGGHREDNAQAKQIATLMRRVAGLSRTVRRLSGGKEHVREHSDNMGDGDLSTGDGLMRGSESDNMADDDVGTGDELTRGSESDNMADDDVETGDELTRGSEGDNMADDDVGTGDELTRRAEGDNIADDDPNAEDELSLWVESDQAQGDQETGFKEQAAEEGQQQGDDEESTV